MKFSEIVIVGRGKLAQAILEGLRPEPGQSVKAWDNYDKNSRLPVIAVHTGSGREMPDLLAFCQESNSVLVEMATAGVGQFENLSFPVLICPNTAILVLKFMLMLSQSGHLMAGNKISITESHQSTKTTLAGTAREIARLVGEDPAKIVSIREPQMQKNTLGIGEPFLSKHAYHKVVVEDGDSSVTFETKVLGHKPYVTGLQEIIALIQEQKLEPKKYEIVEFISNSLASKTTAL